MGWWKADKTTGGISQICMRCTPQLNAEGKPTIECGYEEATDGDQCGS